jgi:uncharacterized membrane protein
MENPSMCEIPIDPRDPPSGTCCARGDAPRPCGAEDFFRNRSRGYLMVFLLLIVVQYASMVVNIVVTFNGFLKHLVFTRVEL